MKGKSRRKIRKFYNQASHEKINVDISASCKFDEGAFGCSGKSQLRPDPCESLSSIFG